MVKIINEKNINTMSGNVNNSNRKLKIRDVFLSNIVVLIFIIALFVSAGSLIWTWGWVFVGIMLANKAISLFILDPELLEERTSVKHGYKGEDVLLSTIMGRLGPLVIIITSGLDFRFGWTRSFPLVLSVIGIVFLICSYVLVLWAMKENKFFSSIVRIQKERGHHVITTGPYRFLRHPGYLGSFIYIFALPFALSSYWGLVPAVITNVLSLVRVVVEDNTLKKELEGYSKYAEKVQYRLIPGIW